MAEAREPFGIEVEPTARDNGLATMLAEMMRQNLADHPRRTGSLRRARGRIAVFAEDAEVATSIDFEGTRALFRDGIVGVPDLTIRGGYEPIGDLARMEHIGPLPDPRGPVNRSLFRAWREGRLRVFGLPRALPLLLAFGEAMRLGE